MGTSLGCDARRIMCFVSPGSKGRVVAGAGSSVWQRNVSCFEAGLLDCQLMNEHGTQHWLFLCGSCCQTSGSAGFWNSVWEDNLLNFSRWVKFLLLYSFGDRSVYKIVNLCPLPLQHLSLY